MHLCSFHLFSFVALSINPAKHQELERTPKQDGGHLQRDSKRFKINSRECNPMDPTISLDGSTKPEPSSAARGQTSDAPCKSVPYHSKRNTQDGKVFY